MSSAVGQLPLCKILKPDFGGFLTADQTVLSIIDLDSLILAADYIQAPFDVFTFRDIDLH